MWPALVLTVSVMLGQTTADLGSLEQARALYDTARYEEALSVLITIENEQNFAEVEQYRALCLVALGRTSDAEGALERLIVHDPLFRIDVSNVSPRLILLYRNVRQRLIPSVARGLYAQGKANFDARRYSLAAMQLQGVVTLLSADEPAAVAEGLPELRQLAEGFLTLSLNASAGATPAVTSPDGPVALHGPDTNDVETSAPLAKPVQAQAEGVEVAEPGRIYSPSDRAVVAPLEIVRRVPTSVELGPNASPRLYQGLLEVVIDEVGRVRKAEVRRPISPSFDAALIESTREWRFQPATLGGTPVLYRKYFEVIVWGMSSQRVFGTR